MVAEPAPPAPAVFMRETADVTLPLPVDDGVTVSVVDEVAPGATVRLGKAYDAGQPKGVEALRLKVVALHPVALSLFRTLTFSGTGVPVLVVVLPGDIVTVGATAVQGTPG